MGLSLCGTGAWSWLSNHLSGATGTTTTQKVKVKGRVKCPCGCNHEFDAEFTVEQEVFGGVKNFQVAAGGGITNLCAWKM